MEIYKAELEKSAHALDKDKNPIGCAQCHIPHRFGLRYLAIKSFMGAKDMWVHYFGDPENLDRRAMQATARRFLPDENCRACHQDLTLDTKDQPLTIDG